MPYADARENMLATLLPQGTDRYVALYDGDPTDGGTELTLTGYSRVAHQDWLTTDNGTNSTRENVGEITFGTFTEAGTATYWGILDAAAAGTLLRSGPLKKSGGVVSPVEIGVGDDVEFANGGLVITLTEV